MITLFSIPKAFRGHFGTIQTNAIGSWARLDPKPEILLFGDDEGTAAMAGEVGARHLPQVARNEYGTPIVSDIFAQAEREARHGLLCYINADIILARSFPAQVAEIEALLRPERFLLVGRKRIVPLPKLLDLDSPKVEAELRAKDLQQGRYGTTDSDYFVFRRGLWPAMPPFLIGRFYWSSWLVYAARKSGARVIDCTNAITAIESAHDYAHMVSAGVAAPEGAVYGMGRQSTAVLRSPEIRYNARLFRGCRYWTTVNSTDIFAAGCLRRPGLRRRMWGQWVALMHQTSKAYRTSTRMHIVLAPVRGAYRLVRPLITRLLQRGLEQSW